MRILVIGSGGREAAIVKKLSEDKRIVKIFTSKGNATTEKYGENINITAISDFVDFAKRESIDLTIVGSEKYLLEGIVDEF